MKLAVMQPYIFPYIGYFQLIYASGLFLIFDDVSYIVRGYINRNVILSSSGEVRFTIPVLEASRNKNICELKFSSDVGKALKKIEHNYSRAPYYEAVFPLVERVLKFEERVISSVCMKSYQEIFAYLGVEKEFKRTSDLSYDRDLPAQERIIALCHKFGASCYINTLGGRDLYSKHDFFKAGVDLKFINPWMAAYPQRRKEFFPGLSIIDILMNCSPEEVKEHMNMYKLV